MKIVFFLCAAILMAGACSPTPPAAATLAPPPTEAPVRPAAETVAPKVNLTPAVQRITAAEDLVGIWRREEPDSSSSKLWREYRSDGTYRVAVTRDGLEANPLVVGEYQFEGTQFIVVDTSAQPGWDECIAGGHRGRYEVQVVQTGKIRFVKLEDGCSSRSMMLPHGEFIRAD